MYQLKLTDARASIMEALKIRERLAAIGLPEDQRGLGSGYFQLGSALDGIDLQASLEAKRRALAIFDALLAAAPTDPEAQRNVALACKSLGATLHDLKRYDEVEHSTERALALDEARLAADSRLGDDAHGRVIRSLLARQPAREPAEARSRPLLGAHDRDSPGARRC